MLCGFTTHSRPKIRVGLIRCQSEIDSHPKICRPCGTSSASKKHLDVPIHLSVDDKTRQWLYFRAQPRTDAERQLTIHKSDMALPTVQKIVQIHNGRGNKDLALDSASFELVKCPTALSNQDFYSLNMATAEATKLLQQYYDEVAEFVKKKLGCDKVVCFNHQIRNAAKLGTDKAVAGYASGGPHTDSSAISGDELALSMCTSEKFERYLYLNLWRNIADEPIETDHLAMLDERTAVKPDDYIVRDIFGDGYTIVQYGLSARHAEQHKWYHFPSMQKHEGILFKNMDSDWTKSGRVCFHMSVADPDFDDPAQKPRESIELRMICFWRKAESGVDSMPTVENTNQAMAKDPEMYAKELFGGASLSTASALDLSRELLCKVPVVGRLARLMCSSPDVGNTGYTGKPEDYVDKFINTVNSFPQWPAVAVGWVRGQMAGKPEDEGIAAITLALVTDKTGHQGTKAFAPAEHREIADYLVKQDKYMAVAKEHWGQFAGRSAAA